MGKKKQRKKHQFKAAHVGGAAIPAVQTSQHATPAARESAAVVAEKRTKATRNSQALAGVEDFGYVSVELKRVAILAVGLVALELILWVLFRQTGLGTRVYQTIKL